MLKTATSTFCEPISRISASGYNSAAFNEHDNLFVWGSGQDHKLGLGKACNTQDTPVYTEWKLEKTGFYNELGKAAMRYQLLFIDRTSPKKMAKEMEIVSQMKAITWGDSHCIMLDKKGRLFSMGSSAAGRLGLSDQ